MNDSLKPYQTKLDRIIELEEAMEYIAGGTLTQEQCIVLAVSLRRTGKKWRRKAETEGGAT